MSDTPKKFIGFDWKADFLRQLEEARQEPSTKQDIELLADIYGSEPTASSVAAASLPREIIRISEAADYYKDEGDRALEGEAFLSSVIMTASHFEATLLILAFLYENEVMQSVTFHRRNRQKGAPSVSQLELGELLDIAEQFNWIPTQCISPMWTELLNLNRAPLSRLAQVNSLPEEPGYALARFIQGVRNTVHPGRFVQRHSLKRDELEQMCVLAHAAYYSEINVTLQREIVLRAPAMKRVRLPKHGPLGLS